MLFHIALAGPTACGKTKMALHLAQQLASQGIKVEIISVDSALVYSGMDIGTAKPTQQERESVAHHLIDILDPSQSYSAAAFVQDAQRLMSQIHARAAIPLLVGGTMLYFKALQDGIDPMPAADENIRKDLEQQALQMGWAAMHAQLAQVDPLTASRLAPNDSQRIQRALEVFRVSGKPLSHFHQQHTKASPTPLRMISLEPTQRSWLHQRIQERFDLMLTQGFLDEMSQLHSRADLHPDLPSMRCVGYRQGWEYFDQLQHNTAAAQALEMLRERSVAATRQLAKRQLTWLRSLPVQQRIACDHDHAPQQVWQTVQSWVQEWQQDNSAQASKIAE